MAGIVLRTKNDKTLSSDSFRKSVENLCVGNLNISEYNGSENIDLAIVSTKNSSASKACYANEIDVFVDGYFVENLGSSDTSAKWFLNLYIKHGLACVRQLNGSFNIVILNHNLNTITLVTDRYGTRPLFYLEDRDNFIVSFRSENVNALSGNIRKLNLNMVANLLSYSRVWYGNETFFDGVECVPSGCIIEWGQGSGVSTRQYMDEEWESFDEKEGSIDELAELLKKIVTDFNRVPNLGMSLSGGLDSRILLAAGFRGPTYTWGYAEGNDEIELAKRCAQYTKNPWSFIKLKPEHFLDTEGHGDHIREGLDLCVQAYALSCYPQIKNKIDGMVTGLALDFTMAGSYTPSGNLSDPSAMKKFAYDRIEYFGQSEREKLLKGNILTENVENIKQGIDKYLQEGIGSQGAAKTLQSFFMTQRVKRYIFQRQQWQRAFYEDYIPTFDNRLVEYLSRFTLEQRAGHKVFQQTLMKLSTGLSLIPYQGTNIPASVPVKYWSDAAKLEAEKEKFYRKVFFETSGDVFIPYNRYYSNFDEWLRTDHAWQTYIREMLISNNSRISQFVHISYVKSMLEDQISGKKAHFGKILTLLSLEKTLRYFF